MNGPLIFTIIQIIKALECVEEENMATTTNVTVTAAATNETSSHIERQILADQNGNNDDEELLTPTDPTKVEELSDLVNLLKKHCTCPCSGVKHIPVCGKTTNGLMKTFDSQCHLICHNQCEQAERYAVKFYGACPSIPPAVLPPPVLSRKNGVLMYSTSSLMGNRRTDGANTGVGAVGSYESFITPLEWQCNCAYCQQTRLVRLDYYPICAERSGQRVTFESWCHFDCENKCVRNSGYLFLYKHKGPCRLSVQVEREDDFGVRHTALPSPTEFSRTTAEPCSACATRCKQFYEPVCTKNSKNEYLSFKSRCHMRCHNLCEYENPQDNFEHILDGQCPWLRAI